MIPVPITDHYGQGVARLLMQFRAPRPVFHGLLRTFISRYQGLEDTVQQVLSGITIDTAVGGQLDTLGKIVGVKRSGRTDVAYRMRIRLQVLANHSSGSINTLMRLARLILPLPATMTIREENHLTTHIIALGLDAGVVRDILDVLNLARSAGYRVLFEYSTTANPTPFRWGISGFANGAVGGSYLTSSQG